VDEMTWGALALVLTVVGALYTWWAFTRRGAAPGVRGLALTMLPPAAWLTGTLELFTEVTGSVADWATGLVLSPTVWLGIALAGSSTLLLLVSRLLPSRTIESRRSAKALGGGAATGDRRDRGELGAGSAPERSEPALDDDLSEVEEILRRRGIS
jgi:hypothetical protein